MHSGHVSGPCGAACGDPRPDSRSRVSVGAVVDSAVVRQPVADRAKRGEEPPGRLAAIMPAEGVSGPGRQLAGLVRELTRHAWDSKVFVLWREGHARPPYAD